MPTQDYIGTRLIPACTRCAFDYELVKELLAANTYPQYILVEAMDTAIGSCSYKIMQELANYIPIPTFKIVKLLVDFKQIVWESMDNSKGGNRAIMLSNAAAAKCFAVLQKISRKQKIKTRGD